MMGLDAGLRRHDGTSLRLKHALSVLSLSRRIEGAWDFNLTDESQLLLAAQ
jgi:hypothetical protein